MTFVSTRMDPLGCIQSMDIVQLANFKNGYFHPNKNNTTPIQHPPTQHTTPNAKQTNNLFDEYFLTRVQFEREKRKQTAVARRGGAC